MGVLLPGGTSETPALEPGPRSKLCSLGLLTHPGHHLAPCHHSHLFVWPCDCFLFCLSSHPYGPVQIIHGGFLPFLFALGQSSITPGSFVSAPASGPCSFVPEQRGGSKSVCVPDFHGLRACLSALPRSLLAESGSGKETVFHDSGPSSFFHT